MLRSTGEAARVLLLSLQQADDGVDLAADAVVGDDRLLAVVEHLDLLGRVLDAMVIAPRVLLLLDFLVLGFEIGQIALLERKMIRGRNGSRALCRSAALCVTCVRHLPAHERIDNPA
jgi:hypothetical protein